MKPKCKRLLSVAIVLLPFALQTAHSEVVAAWDFAGLTAFGPSPMPPTSAPLSVAVVGLTRGSGLTTNPTAASNAWGANGWEAVADAATAVGNNDFLTFSVAAQTGYKLSLSGFDAYNVRRSSQGPTTGQWQYQVGGGAFVDLGGPITWGTNTTSTGNLQATIDLSGIAELQSLAPGTVVTFRLANYAGSGAGGNWYLNNFQTGNDFTINGTLTPDNPPGNLSVAIAPSSIAENAGAAAATGTITRSGNTAAALQVNLASNDTSEATAPATVEIPAGQASATFPVAAIDDFLPDGTQTVTITAQALGYNNGTGTVDVTDDGDVYAVAINEIMVNGAYDTNGDGVTGNENDEFVELVNTSGTILDLGNWTISDAIGVRHVFPEGTALVPNSAIVVFGGGTPSGVFGGAIVQTASTTTLGLNNSGDTITIRDAANNIRNVVTVTAAATPADSFNLSPDVTGTSYAGHLTLTDPQTPYSPGTKLDGSPFVVLPTLTLAITPSTFAENAGPGAATGTVTRSGDTTNAIDVKLGNPDPSEVAVPATVTIPAGQASANFPVDAVNDMLTDGSQNVTISATLLGYLGDSKVVTVTDDGDVTVAVFNEIYSYVGTGATYDANGDGTTDINQDEFLEIANKTGAQLDLSGWTIHDRTALRHTFPAGTVLSAGGVVVVFGGGTPVGTFGGAIVQTASGGTLSLDNSATGATNPFGDTLTLKDPLGNIRTVTSYDGTVTEQSYNLNPDITGTSYIGHLLASSTFSLFSPGLKLTGASFPAPPVDNSPPSWASGWPKVDTIGDTSFTIRAKTNEAGAAHYVILASGASAPSAAQVKAGQDASGAAAPKSGTISLIANLENAAAINGLAQATGYDVWLVAEDGKPNLQASPVKVSATTTSSVPTYASWIAGYPGVGTQTAFGDDPDFDGQPNGLENYLGSDPGQPGAGLYQVSGGPAGLVFRHTRNNTVASNVSGAYQWSSDLQTWRASGVANGAGTTVTLTPATVTDNTAPVPDVIEVTAAIAGTPAGQVYVRLVATQTGG